jgi:hypothetical protein
MVYFKQIFKNKPHPLLDCEKLQTNSVLFAAILQRLGIIQSIILFFVCLDRSFLFLNKQALLHFDLFKFFN